MVRLPEFKGYTFDFRLKQIRRIKPDESMQFIEMESQEGQFKCDEFFASKKGQKEFARYIEEYQKAGYDLDLLM